MMSAGEQPPSHMTDNRTTGGGRKGRGVGRKEGSEGRKEVKEGAEQP